MEEILFLKYHDITVGLLTVIDNIPKQLEILRSDLFFDRHKKNILFGDELIEWIKDRVRPNAQIGLNKILKSFGIDDSGSMWYWDLFLKTRGMNVKDRLWISKDEFDNSPWDLLLTIDKDIPEVDLYKKYLNVNKSYYNINLIGACEKSIVRVNGNLAILKHSLQHNTFDGIAEELCYLIARSLGINCAEAKYLGNGLSLSFIDENIDLIHAEAFLDTDTRNVETLYKKLVLKDIDKRVRIDFLRLFLFDILTRQMDRNLTNFGFYKINSYVKLYRLYDNGLSLFSSVKFNSKLEYSSVYGNSEDILRYVVRQLKNELVDKPFAGHLSIEFLDDIFKQYANEIMQVKGTDYKDIVKWIMNMHDHILEKF
ncbi:hypothetical protein [Clostridium butyricum]|uniref:hypothetical protein n=1 Tax=Clostridium butyricum TaxID=1492 RepID=UPI0009037169|nr:hypothetical protein [Clostridium butyricum]APF24388.1 hypothetical protein NPD4_1833 [Clostridium butyricum]